MSRFRDEKAGARGAQAAHLRGEVRVVGVALGADELRGELGRDERPQRAHERMELSLIHI